MRRSCEAFDFLDCSTEGAVGKKSAKPLEARDMVDDATIIGGVSDYLLVRMNVNSK